MSIIKTYTDGMVIPAGRYNQFEEKNIPIYYLLKKQLIGYVNIGRIFVIYFENERYYRCFFAKNKLWFDALTAEPEYNCIKELSQFIII